MMENLSTKKSMDGNVESRQANQNVFSDLFLLIIL